MGSVWHTSLEWSQSPEGSCGRSVIGANDGHGEDGEHCGDGGHDEDDTDGDQHSPNLSMLTHYGNHWRQSLCRQWMWTLLSLQRPYRPPQHRLQHRRRLLLVPLGA